MVWVYGRLISISLPLLQLAFLPSVSPFSPRPHHFPVQRRLSSHLQAEKKQRGVYVRPSGAIERGSGFFVPGLEGPKVRVVGGSVLLALIGVNHLFATVEDAGNTFSELLALVFACLVLVQAGIEYIKEARAQQIFVGDSLSPDAPVVTLQQAWLVPASNQVWKERVEWAAKTYLGVTPATEFYLIGPGSIVFGLGVAETPESGDTEKQACQTALDTLVSSSSGRVALPTTHPVSQALVPGRRTVVLQTVDADQQLGFLMASDDLIAAFTQNDLKWLGELARYVDDPFVSA